MSGIARNEVRVAIGGGNERKAVRFVTQGRRGRQAKHAAAGHGIAGVHHQIHEELMQLRRIAVQVEIAFRKLHDEFDPRAENFPRLTRKIFGPPDDRKGLPGRFSRLRKPQDFLRDPFPALQ